MPGDYNEGNATSAIIATLLAGAKGEDARKTLDRVHIPGRMEIIKTKIMVQSMLIMLIIMLV